MALIRGQEVKEGPKQYPANPKLWNMQVAQAKARFRVYPSPAAAHWVHSHYAQLGGRFVNKESEIDPRFRDYTQEAMDKKEAEAKAKVTNKVGRGGLAGKRFRG
jgi:hypothetical protein